MDNVKAVALDVSSMIPKTNALVNDIESTRDIVLTNLFYSKKLSGEEFYNWFSLYF